MSGKGHAMTATRYEAVVSRSGKWWHIVVPQTGPMAMTQARRLADAEAMTRDMLALLLDLNPADIAVDVRVDNPAAATAAEVTRLRAAERDAHDKAQRGARQAVREMAAQGLPLRDIAALLEVSPAWAGRLLRSDNAA